MKRLMGIITAAIMAALIFFSYMPAKKTIAATNPVIYFVPHADDETLSMSIDIRNRYREGRTVYLVLASEGEHSFAREVANGKCDSEYYRSNCTPGTPVYCDIHKKYHDPIAENYASGYLTLEKFGQSRVDDFYRVAQGSMSVPAERIFHEKLPNDGFTYDAVHDMILKYHNMFPDADLRTTSWGDIHPDHAMLGRVLEDMKQNGELGNTHTLYFWSIATRMDGTNPPPRTLYHGVLLDSSDWWYINKAITYYKTWDPSHGRYENGYHSVPTQFDYFEDHKDMYYHY